jgi:hypothetical protein
MMSNYYLCQTTKLMNSPHFVKRDIILNKFMMDIAQRLC